MCGIAGMVSLDGALVSHEAVRGMCDAIRHRGPDEDGYYAGEGASLGMRRLSIIDLATGKQPISGEDGRSWVVFNGEIYNFKQVRQDLQARGHVFTTGSDTEAIVHLYEERGLDCVSELRGMFAFAVWDERRRRLLLARDRLGIKPLYYAEVEGRLVFASELKALLALPELRAQIDWGSFAHFLASLTTPETRSILRGVHKLPPGHLLTASRAQGVRVQRYWDVAFEPREGRSEEDWARELRGRLEECVKLHMVSDVPLGAFLSGGLDSSAVVATMARLSPQRVKTFSIGFGDPDYSEAPHARRVAEAFGTDHHELIVEPDALSILDELTYHLDEPFGDSSAIPTYLVSKLAAQHVKVVLSGDGGDELFAGYDRYAVEERERGARFLPALARRAMGALGEALPEGVRGRNSLLHFAQPGDARYLDSMTLFKRRDLPALLRPDVLEQIGRDDPGQEFAVRLAAAPGHWLSRLQYLDLKTYLPLDILTKVDRMSMAHSIEARVPLLDHTLVEFAATIPPRLLLRNGNTKRLFKNAMRDRLPEGIADRPKRGFAIPLGRWFKGGLLAFARDLLLSQASRERGVLEPRAIERLLDRPSRDAGLGLELWSLISFELWCRTFLDGRASMLARQRRAS